MYKLKKVPIKGDYIKFSDGTGVVINWKEERVVNILCDSAPIVNNFISNNFIVNLKVDRKYFEVLVKEGKQNEFIRYKIVGD